MDFECLVLGVLSVMAFYNVFGLASPQKRKLYYLFNVSLNVALHNFLNSCSIYAKLFLVYFHYFHNSLLCGQLHFEKPLVFRNNVASLSSVGSSKYIWIGVTTDKKIVFCTFLVVCELLPF